MNLSKVITSMLVLVLMLGLTSANAQMREVVIENTGMPNVIRDAIVADLDANGEDVVNNTKYILQRGETYPHTEQYEPSHKVWLEAEAGDGPLPRILGVSTGGEAPRMVRATDDMTFIGLRYEGLDSDGNHTDNAPMRQRGKGTTLTCKDNIFPDHRHEIFRVDDTEQKWYVENNLIVRNYRKNNWVFGYTFSFRDQQIDSFVIKNNTFYNATGGLMHSDNTVGCNYFEFSNNTVYGVGGLYVDFIYVNQFEAALVNSGVAQNVKITDNLIQNSMVWGYEPEWSDSLSIINVNLTDSTDTIDVRNNNIWRDPEFLASNPEDVETIKWFDDELAGLIGEDGAAHGFISEEVTFNNVPSLQPLQDALVSYFDSPSAVTDIYLELPTEPSAENVDFGYSAKVSPTASTTGGPLGDARWFDGVTVGVEDRVAGNVESFTLHGNYPNPFNPSTTIRFDLPAAADVQVSFINTLGQVVHETPMTSFAAGMNHEINVDGSDWASGVYFYQVKADMSANQVLESGKMMLLK